MKSKVVQIVAIRLRNRPTFRSMPKFVGTLHCWGCIVSVWSGWCVSMELPCCISLPLVVCLVDECVEIHSAWHICAIVVLMWMHHLRAHLKTLFNKARRSPSTSLHWSLFVAIKIFLHEKSYYISQNPSQTLEDGTWTSKFVSYLCEALKAYSWHSTRAADNPLSIWISGRDLVTDTHSKVLWWVQIREVTTGTVENITVLLASRSNRKKPKRTPTFFRDFTVNSSRIS